MIVPRRRWRSREKEGKLPSPFPIGCSHPMTTAFVHHPDCVRHDMGAGHPERAARVTAIDDQLLVSGLLEQLAGHLAPIVDRAALERVHATAHINTRGSSRKMSSVPLP